MQNFDMNPSILNSIHYSNQDNQKKRKLVILSMVILITCKTNTLQGLHS